MQFTFGWVKISCQSISLPLSALIVLLTGRAHESAWSSLPDALLYYSTTVWETGVLALFVVILFLSSRIKTEKHVLIDKSASESSSCQSVVCFRVGKLLFFVSILRELYGFQILHHLLSIIYALFVIHLCLFLLTGTPIYLVLFLFSKLPSKCSIFMSFCTAAVLRWTERSGRQSRHRREGKKSLQRTVKSVCAVTSAEPSNELVALPQSRSQETNHSSRFKTEGYCWACWTLCSALALLRAFRFPLSCHGK